jgi:predicted Rossmann fold nucleotide-binding protein DprA/Smf involved in DNA uptake
MDGALRAGGEVAGVMADSLERAALAREDRESLIEGRLVLISPYDPAAGFNVGHAMQRNKVIYALADAALVVTSDFEKGGTWAGAIEQLDRLHLVPVFVRNGPNAGRGNAALLYRGGKPWPNPPNAGEFGSVLLTAAESVASGPRQEVLPLALREVAPAAEAPRPAPPSGPGRETPDSIQTCPSPDDEASPLSTAFENAAALTRVEPPPPRSATTRSAP